MNTYPISSNLCKKISLQCYRLYNFSSFRSSHWRCSVRKGVLRNFATFTGKQLWQSLLFNKLQAEATASNLSRVFSWRFLAYFISAEKWNQKREIPCWSSNIYFLLEYRFDWRQRFKKKIDRWLFDQKMCLKGIWCCSFHG